MQIGRRKWHVDRRSFVAGGAAAAASLPTVAGAFAGGGAAVKIQRLAWAGIRIRQETSTLLIDPAVNSVLGSSLKDPMIPVDDPIGDTYVLITHRHPDHFDALAVKQALGNGGTLVYPSDAGPLPAQGEKVRLRAAPLWEPQILGDFTATAVPAADGYGDPQASWVVSAGGMRLFHAGDSLWHGHWWHIGRAFGPFDTAFLPINGARFEWRKPVSEVAAVMTPEQAVAAAVIIGSRQLVPIHYGAAGTPGYKEEDRLIDRLEREAARRGIKVRILKPGEWLKPAEI